MKIRSHGFSLLILTAVMLGLLAFGCAGAQQPSAESPKGSPAVTQSVPTAPVPTVAQAAAGKPTATQSQTVTVTDQTGASVTIPRDPQRIVSVYPMSTLIVYSLRGQSKLVGIDSNSPNNKILQQADPNITKITTVGMPWEVNVETVVSLEPDIVIGASGDARKALEGAKLPVIGVNLESPDKLKEGIKLISNCIGKQAEADAMLSYFDEKRKVIADRVKGIPEGERVKVLIPTKVGKLSAAGKDRYQHFMITGAGGINVGESITGGNGDVSIEQILAWNPQVIIVPPYCADKPEDIISDTKWQSVDAVKNKRVYLMPEYTVAWDTPVADSILGELWVAKQLYPDKFEDIDIDAEANAFYTQFYGIPYGSAGASNQQQTTIVDSLGSNVTIPANPKRIASLRSGITEIICALGQEAKIVAVDEMVKAGGGYGEFITSVHPDLKNRDCPVSRDVNLEELLRIDPDVVLHGGFGRIKQADAIKKQTTIPVVIAHFETLEDYMNDIRITAKVVGAESRAEELIKYLQDKLNFVADKVKDVPESQKVRVFYGGHDVYHAYGGDTFEHSQIVAAGGVNVAEDLEGWLPEVSPEQLLLWDPQVIVLLNGTSVDDVLNDAKLARVSAVKNKKVYSLPEAGWDYSSPRALFCIEWLASKLYPERFENADIAAEADAFYQEVFGVKYGGPPLVD